MSKVSITRSLLDDLAMSISAKSGEPVPLTLTEMKDAVDGISGGDTTIDPLSVTSNGTYTAQSGHAYSPVTVNVPTSTPSLQSKTKTYTPTESAQTESVSADSGYDGLDTVSISVGAISNTYVGTGITRRSSTDMTASGATVTVPSGYYESNASKTIPNAEPFIGIENGFYTENGVTKWRVRGNVEIDPNEGDTPGYLGIGNISGEYQSFNAVPSNTTVIPTTSSQTIGGANYMMEGAVTVSAMPTGTAGTPTATKGSVSNHQVSVTPSVTNTTGYITGSTKTGTAVSVSASELVSGTYTVDSSGTKDVTNYASASVPSGTAGTPTATKGTVSNHSVSVTPSVTNQTGYITGSTKTGTAVTVSASELVSGSETKTENGTYNVTNLASLVVALEFSTIYTGSGNPSSSTGVNGDIYLKVVS